MKEIKLENKIGKIISDPTEITIKKLMRCEEILEDNLMNELDKYTSVIQELSNLTIDEIEDLKITTLKEVILIVSQQNFDMKDNVFVNEFKFDGITFKNKSTEDNFHFSVKEIYKIKEIFNKKSLKINFSLATMASIIFRELDSEGNISRDFSDEALEKREEIFMNMTLDVILPYVVELKNHV